MYYNSKFNGALQVDGIPVKLASLFQTLSTTTTVTGTTYSNLWFTSDQTFGSPYKPRKFDITNPLLPADTTIDDYTAKRFGSTGIYVLNDGFTLYNGATSNINIKFNIATAPDFGSAAANRMHRIVGATDMLYYCGRDTAKIKTCLGFNSNVSDSISITFPSKTFIRFMVSISDMNQFEGFVMYAAQMFITI